MSTNIGLILARGGSKGIPRKNLQKIGDFSLVFRSAYIAKKSNLDDVYVYSDDDEILLEAEKANAEAIKRPPELSTDTITSEETIIGFMDQLKLSPEINIMLIQCTTPFMKSKYINEAITKLEEPGMAYSTIISVTRCWKYLGYKDKYSRWLAVYPYRWLRQDYIPPFYHENGGFYLSRQTIWRQNKRIGLKCGFVEMGPWESMEIDDTIDLEVARQLAQIKEIDNACQGNEEGQEISCN